MTNEKKLLRRQKGIVAGVCGGLGEFFGIPAFWFRLAFILMMLPGGIPGILIYLIAWVVIPKLRG
ncbi:MAG: PspC domain-containing protein [Caldilineaceae bacterium]